MENNSLNSVPVSYNPSPVPAKSAGQANVSDKKVIEPPVDKDVQKEQSQNKELDLNEAVDKLNKTAKVFERSLQFKVHDETHRTMVSVVDTANDKVIRQYPSEEVLDMVAKMDSYLGIIFDKKA